MAFYQSMYGGGRVLLALCMLTVTYPEAASAAKVLLYPYATGFHSRWINMQKLGRILQDAGHQVHIVVPDVNIHHMPDTNITTFMYSPPNMGMLLSPDEFVDRVRNVTKYEFADTLLRQQVAYCEKLLQARYLLAQLKEERYDVFILDYLDNCGRLLIDYIDVPSILFSNFGFSIESDIFAPVPVAHAPHPLSSYTDSMNFLQRLKNAIDYTLSILMYKYYYLSPFERMRQEHRLNTSLAVADSFHRATLVFCNTDFVLDFPRPLMPHVIPIGGIFYEGAMPLPTRLEEFVMGSGAHGLIVVSFGSMFGRMPGYKAEMFARVFSRLPQRVIWRYTGEKPRNLSDNTMVMPWLPQNDLLGHSQTKLFISHCGISAVHEAIGNAVPVVAIPLFADQFYQAAKLIDRGQMGVKLDYWTLTEAILHEAIETVINKPIYTERAKRLSRLVRDKPIGAKDNFLFWVDYVVRNGRVDHLEPKAVRSLSWFEFLLLDVVVFITFSIILFVGSSLVLVQKMKSFLDSTELSRVKKMI